MGDGFRKRSTHPTVCGYRRANRSDLREWTTSMNRIATLAMAGVVATCLGAGLALAATDKPAAKFVWPKDNRFTCRGILAEDQGSLKLTPDQNMLAWCDADIDDKDGGRVLDVCKLGDRCEIKGTIRGHGTFGWVEIKSIVRPVSSK